MDTIAIGSTLGILIVMQAFIIWECIRMKGTVAGESSSLRTELGNLGLLLDEAIDFLADSKAPSPMMSQASADFKEIALTALMNKMMMPSGYGSEKEPEVRQIQQDDTQTQ